MGDRRKPSRLGIKIVLESLGLWRVKASILLVQVSLVVCRMIFSVDVNPPPSKSFSFLPFCNIHKDIELFFFLNVRVFMSL